MENLKFIKTSVLLVAISLLGFSCSQKASNNSTTTAPIYTMSNGNCYSTQSGQMVSPSLCNASLNQSISGYSYSNGLCISTSNGQQVDPGYCNGSMYGNGTNYGNSQFMYMNGVCVSVMNGQQVNPNYCAASNTGMGTGGQQCIGTYYSPQMNQYGTCNGTNCRGMTLIDSSGRQVFCQ